VNQLPAAFAAVLEAERDALNARYTLRQRGGSRIDGVAFLAHLRQAVAPLAEQIHAILPERTRTAVLALYDVSLDLFAASLLGAEAKTPLIGRVWTELLPLVVKLLAREPQQVAGCLCNAAFRIAGQLGTKPNTWLARMQAAAPHCESVAQLLEIGKVAAWQAGMVQYRAAALAAAGKLPAALAAAALGLPPSVTAEMMKAILDRLNENPWHSAAAALNSKQEHPQIACVATAGAFVGFGGLFFRPPVVESHDGRLFVSDGRSQWELLADACGAWFRRLGDAPAKRAPADTRGDLSIDRHGKIRWGKLSLEVPHLAHASSFAHSGATLAVTIPTSHHVFLFSSRGAPA